MSSPQHAAIGQARQAARDSRSCSEAYEEVADRLCSTDLYPRWRIAVRDP